MKPPRPIQTSYSGCDFRSRLEARWATFFDALGIAWRYEFEGFELPGGRYLPDFWLPQVRMWGEVKPERFTDEENAKAIDLVRATGCPVLRLIDVPENKHYMGWCREYPHDLAVELRTFALTAHKGYPQREGRFYCEPAYDERFDDTEAAACAARAKRFEFKRDVHPAMRALMNHYAATIRAAPDPWKVYAACKAKLMCACADAEEEQRVAKMLADISGL